MAGPAMNGEVLYLQRWALEAEPGDDRDDEIWREKKKVLISVKDIAMEGQEKKQWLTWEEHFFWAVQIEMIFAFNFDRNAVKSDVWNGSRWA